MSLEGPLDLLLLCGTEVLLDETVLFVNFLLQDREKVARMPHDVRREKDDQVGFSLRLRLGLEKVSQDRDVPENRDLPDGCGVEVADQPPQDHRLPGGGDDRS